MAHGTSLGRATFRGIVWNFVEQFLRRGVAAASTLILSYLLTPEDFGLISMLALFIALASGLMDSGFRDALIRRRRLSERLLNTAFWASLLLGSLAYLVLFVLAPWVASFYAQPMLQPMLRVLGLVVLINAVQLAPAARLAHALDFKAVMQASLPASLVSCLAALLLAWWGLGVWALIAQSVLAALVMTALIWRRAGWRPRFAVDWKPLTALYGFGYKLFLSALISIVVRNAAPSLIGKFLGVTLAGYYYFVDKVMEMVMGQLVYSIQNVTYSAFSKISGDIAQLKAAYRKVVEVTVFVVSPCLAIAAGLAQPLFSLIFSPQWQPAVYCFQWMCVTFMLYPLHAINLNILKVKGRSDIFLGLEVIKAVITLGILAVSVHYGLIAVLFGQLLGSAVCYVPNSFYSKRLIDYSVFEQAVDALPYFFAAGLAGCLAAWLAGELSGLPLIVGVGCAGCSGVVAYIALCVLFRRRAPALFASALVRALQRDV